VAAGQQGNSNSSSCSSSTKSLIKLNNTDVWGPRVRVLAISCHRRCQFKANLIWRQQQPQQHKERPEELAIAFAFAPRGNFKAAW